jgi:hypothetical protein
MPSSVSELLTALSTASNGKFSEAAKLIQKYPLAMALMNEAVTIANQKGLTIKYGGIGTAILYPYAYGVNFYSSQLADFQKPPERVMTYFLFEMQNAIRAWEYGDLYNKARNVATFSSDSYIFLILQYETEGAIRVGRMWDEIIAAGKKMNPPAILTLDSKSEYYRSLHLLFLKYTKELGDSSKALTKVIQDHVRYTQYQDGSGETRQIRYKKQYDEIRSGKTALALSDYAPVGIV